METIQKSPFVFLIFILFIIVFGFVYAILMKPMGVVYNQAYNDSILQADQQYQDFYIRSKTIWDWFPLVAIIVMVYWAIIKTHQRNEYGG